MPRAARVPAGATGRRTRRSVPERYRELPPQCLRLQRGRRAPQQAVGDPGLRATDGDAVTVPGTDLANARVMTRRLRGASPRLTAVARGGTDSPSMPAVRNRSGHRQSDPFPMPAVSSDRPYRHVFPYWAPPPPGGIKGPAPAPPGPPPPRGDAGSEPLPGA